VLTKKDEVVEYLKKNNWTESDMI
jgi:hypothetical protein